VEITDHPAGAVFAGGRLAGKISENIIIGMNNAFQNLPCQSVSLGELAGVVNAFQHIPCHFLSFYRKRPLFKRIIKIVKTLESAFPESALFPRLPCPLRKIPPLFHAIRENSALVSTPENRSALKTSLARHNPRSSPFRPKSTSATQNPEGR
jgi:hypothetical protein